MAKISRKLLREVRDVLEWFAENQMEFGIDNEYEVKNRVRHLAVQCKKIENKEKKKIEQSKTVIG